MKKSIMIKALSLIFILCLLSSCVQTAKDPETTDPVVIPVVTTSPSDPGEGVADVGGTTEYRVKIPNLLDDNAVPSENYGGNTPVDENAEMPITGWREASEYHSSHKAVSIPEDSMVSYNFTEWHEGRSALSLIDGDDNYFNEEGSGTKMGGGVGNDFRIEFKAPKTVTLVGYAFVTGNDSGQYAERSPGAWVLSGSSDGRNWTVLDEVKSGGIRAADHEYFGYEIDESARGRYLYYKIEFKKDINGNNLSSFQLNELYIYTD